MIPRSFFLLISFLALHLSLWIPESRAEIDTSNWVCNGVKPNEKILEKPKAKCGKLKGLCAYICFFDEIGVLTPERKFVDGQAINMFNKLFDKKRGKAIFNLLKPCIKKLPKVDNSPNCLGGMPAVKCVANGLAKVCHRSLLEVMGRKTMKELGPKI